GGASGLFGRDHFEDGVAGAPDGVRKPELADARAGRGPAAAVHGHDVGAGGRPPVSHQRDEAKPHAPGLPRPSQLERASPRRPRVSDNERKEPPWPTPPPAWSSTRERPTCRPSSTPAC